jgi:transposase
VELTADERAELRDLLYSAHVPATVAMRARIVLWRAENRLKKDIAGLAGVSRPTVDLWLSRYGEEGIAGLFDHVSGAGREQVPASVRARILAVTRGPFPLRWTQDEMPPDFSGDTSMGSTRRRFTEEYKAQAVAFVIEDHRPIAEVARDIGVAEMTLGRWVKKARESSDSRAKPLEDSERAELERLRAENAELRMRVEFAKKVATWFAKGKQ